ncbi:unnamed protein product [Amoebophrya sp. A25]|nr:unnamed protein product [Amoebophrya sp. A25]|eukprot:GSA25T00009840001.1
MAAQHAASSKARQSYPTGASSKLAASVSACASSAPATSQSTPSAVLARTHHRLPFSVAPLEEIPRQDRYAFTPLLRKVEAWFSCKVVRAGGIEVITQPTSSFHLRRAFANSFNNSFSTSDLDLIHAKMKRDFVAPYIKSPQIHARFEIGDLVAVLQAVVKRKGMRSAERLLEALLGMKRGMWW